MTLFDFLVLFGSGLTLIGFAGLVWCILRVMKARRANLSDEDMRGVLAKVLPMNLGAFAVSVLGLMCVILGISLG
jgi:hypothetical protein